MIITGSLPEEDVVFLEYYRYIFFTDLVQPDLILCVLSLPITFNPSFP